jgi:hypothetical protein
MYALRLLLLGTDRRDRGGSAALGRPGPGRHSRARTAAREGDPAAATRPQPKMPVPSRPAGRRHRAVRHPRYETRRVRCLSRGDRRRDTRRLPGPAACCTGRARGQRSVGHQAGRSSRCGGGPRPWAHRPRTYPARGWAPRVDPQANPTPTHATEAVVCAAPICDIIEIGACARPIRSRQSSRRQVVWLYLRKSSVSGAALAAMAISQCQKRTFCAGPAKVEMTSCGACGQRR